MKVIICAYDYPHSCGGPYNWIKSLSAYLRKRGIVLKILIIYRGDAENCSLITYCSSSGILHEALDHRENQYIETQIEWILKECQDFSPSVFIANLVLPALYASRWLKKAGIKTIGVIHSDPLYDPFYAEMIQCFVSGYSEWALDCVVCVSKFLVEKITATNDNGVRIEQISCGTPIPKKKASPPVDTLRVLYAGRLVQESKRIRELCRSLAKITADPGIEATICGGGSEESFVKEISARYKGLTYLGNIPSDKMQQIMGSHHVIVLLSDYEGLPMSLIEGMACGLVPVCLDERSGVREVLQDGVNGIIVKNREDDFEAAIRRLKDPVLWRSLSRAAVQTIEMNYANGIEFKKWEKLIFTLADPSAGTLQPFPRKVNIREHWHNFRNFQQLRPSKIKIISKEISHSWVQFRLLVRPRARWRILKQNLIDKLGL